MAILSLPANLNQDMIGTVQPRPQILVLGGFILLVQLGLANMVAKYSKYALAKQSCYICFGWYVVINV